MRTILFTLGLSFLIVLTAGAVTPAPPDSLGWRIPDGTFSTVLPSGWESNPRLAEDNGVIAFFHPSGMKEGDDLPAWILAEYRSRVAEMSIDLFKTVLIREGQEHGFVLASSEALKSEAGPRAYRLHFKPSKSGAVRALALVETPKGALLLRHESVDSSAWKKYEGGFAQILSALRVAAR